MPRGRQYYDPIIQAPSRVDTPESRRIELYPEHDVRDNVESLRWCARLIGDDGLIAEQAPGSVDHDDALQQAQALWPGLEVFELREESEDSTHEGMGPSPRLWQNTPPQMGFPGERILTEVPPAPPEPPDMHLADLAERPVIAMFPISVPGTYIRVEDVVVLLEGYAVQYDEQGNPSGALALREAAAALREPF